MKATELMIGDWIMNPNDGKYYRVHTITACEQTRLSNPYNLTDLEYGLGEPIPLTEGILEKNGWVSHRDDERGTMDDMFYKCVGHVYFHPDGYVEADIMGYGIGYNGTGKFRGETIYVHEFQRALRCCGLWDLADNFIV